MCVFIVVKLRNTSNYFDSKIKKKKKNQNLRSHANIYIYISSLASKQMANIFVRASALCSAYVPSGRTMIVHIYFE